MIGWPWEVGRADIEDWGTEVSHIKGLVGAIGSGHWCILGKCNLCRHVSLVCQVSHGDNTRSNCGPSSKRYLLWPWTALELPKS